MITLPVLRWGARYASLETTEVVHFDSGELIARVGQANGGLVQRDLRRASAARKRLKQVGHLQLLASCERAADLFLQADLPIGIDGETQSPEEFVQAQSASTGLPEHMCRANMQKSAFVLRNMSNILEALTRGLDLEILARGYGLESRGVLVSYLAQSPILGAVLPSNSPGVHTLWLPTIPLQVGLVLKPGSSEPWTPYRVISALTSAGVPAEAMSIYPGDHDVGNVILAHCPRSMIFGSQETVQRYAGNPRVQVHGPGFSKILFGDDLVDDWPEYLDLLVESILSNGGRSCINCSTVMASRHTLEIARALARRLGPIQVKSPSDPESALAAFTVPGQASSVWALLESALCDSGVTDCTAPYGPRLVTHARCAYLRPVIAHCASTRCELAFKEFMFPCCSVVHCPQAEMISHIGPTLVLTAITRNEEWIADLTETSQIDRLNIGPIPTNRLNWLQPHEGNLVEFLYRSRALQRE
jgi:acyl-CoA reductase-like NAD-dependent aldehyde dehydrogenase